ncbi:hypothetical protein C4552_02360 [Candidatus Parcubacteria bacterium]|nr:MAG: hypothetical protein C4552_02360 [Candidatus Parcubacteria bacterium]
MTYDPSLQPISPDTMANLKMVKGAVLDLGRIHLVELTRVVESKEIVTDYKTKNRVLGTIRESVEQIDAMLAAIVRELEAAGKLAGAVRQTLGVIDGVHAVFFEREGRVTHIWTVLSADDRSVEEAVYAGERKIIDKLGSTPLDFHLVVRDGRPLDERFPRATCLYKRTLR